MPAGLRATWVAWAAVFGLGPHPGCGFPLHEIYDVQADIRDLDVGDLDDMESDLPPQFLDSLQKRKMPAPSMADMTNPADWAMGASSGMQMTFAVLTQQKAEQLGKSGSDTLAAQWRTLMETGGVQAQLYVTDPGKFLIVVTKPGALRGVKEFVLGQPDIDWFEFNQQRFYPEGRSEPLMDNEARKSREIELGWKKESAAAAKPPAKPAKKPAKKAKEKETAKASETEEKKAEAEAPGDQWVEVTPDGQTVAQPEAKPQKAKRRRRRKAKSVT